MKLSLLSAELDLSYGSLPDIEISGLSADSRKIEPGYLFAALSGETVDGARFINDAVKKGAAAVLCAEDADLGDISVPILRHENPRLVLALMARKFYPQQPDVLVAITGTNGKSSIASFVRQIWEFLGQNAASIGTIGIETSGGILPLSHTTPDPVAISELLQDLSRKQIDHVAFEASSHGLAQFRLHGLKLTAGAFSNISRDHLDYHETFEDYFAQKMRLFEDVLLPGATAVISADHEHSKEVITRARKRGLVTMSVGHKGEDIKLLKNNPQDLMQNLLIEHEGETYQVCLPLAGSFQVENALLAAGLVIASGASPGQVFPALSRLTGAKGRLEKIATTPENAPIFVDYAHTPDALENALNALRPITESRLIIVFGCGGDRDRGKRPLMGEIADKNADLVIVTDDNPRSENPDEIRAEILKSCPQAEDIGGRRHAIFYAISHLKAGDVLLIAGKGHETGQIIGDQVLPFSDHEVVLEIINSV